MPLNKARYFQNISPGMELVVAAGSGIAYPDHNHVSTHTFGLVRSGLLRLRQGKEKRLLRAGDAFAVPPYCPHSLQAASSFEMVTICIGKAILDRQGQEERFAAVLGGLDKLRRRGLLNATEVRTIRKLVHAVAAAAVPAAVDDPLERLKNDIEANPSQSLDLAAMAKRVHMDRFHFLRAFKKRYGLAPRHFQNQSRLRLAKRSCRDGETPVLAALQAGFYDQSHFSHACKKMTGLTPLQYRNACRSQ